MATVLIHFYLYATAFAALGFIVVMIEGRGMPNRDKAFYYSHGRWPPPAPWRTGSPISANWRRTIPAMDLDRVGIVRRRF